MSGRAVVTVGTGPRSDLKEQPGDSRLEEWIRLYRPRLVAQCRRIVPPEQAEDMAQEACLRAYRKIGQFRGDFESFPGWLWAIARSVCLNRLSASRRMEPLDEELATHPVGPHAAVDEQLVLEADKDKLLRLIQEIAVEQRVCLQLLYFRELTYEQIAERTGWTVKAVKSHIQNGKRMLRVKWDGERP